MENYHYRRAGCQIFFPEEFRRGHYLVLRVRVQFHLGVRVSGMIRVTVGVRVMVRVSNLLGSD